MKLSEIVPSENIKVLVVGPAGSGKSCFAAGFPLPILVFDYDGKINSAAAFYANDKERLSQIEVKDMRRNFEETDHVAEMLRVLREEVVPNPTKYKTIVIDSATTFSAAMLRHVVKTNPGVKRTSSVQGLQPGLQDYGILKREFARIISSFLALPVNFVMLGHVSTDKNDLTGEIIRTPNLDGSFGAELPIYFEEVYRSYMKDGKPFAQTKSDSYYEFCRSQIPRLPNPVELKYENLIKK